MHFVTKARYVSLAEIVTELIHFLELSEMNSQNLKRNSR